MLVVRANGAVPSARFNPVGGSGKRIFRFLILGSHSVFGLKFLPWSEYIFSNEYDSHTHRFNTMNYEGIDAAVGEKDKIHIVAYLVNV